MQPQPRMHSDRDLPVVVVVLLEIHLDRHVIGGPERVRDEILSLAQAAAADEVMIMTQAHEHAKRRRSYELVARALGVEPREAVLP